MGTVTADFSPRTVWGGRKVVDVVVSLSGFAGTGRVQFNRPHVAIKKNGRIWLEDQPHFNTPIYQLELERVLVAPGDVVTVEAWWNPDEVRDGSVQTPLVCGKWTA